MQASLDRLLVAPAPTAAAETLQQHMKLVTEAFKRTMALAESLQEVVGEAANVADLANAVFSDILGDYPDMELQWLRLLHQTKSSQVRLHKSSTFVAGSLHAEFCFAALLCRSIVAVIFAEQHCRHVSNRQGPHTRHA